MRFITTERFSEKGYVSIKQIKSSGIVIWLAVSSEVFHYVFLKAISTPNFLTRHGSDFTSVHLSRYALFQMAGPFQHEIKRGPNLSVVNRMTNRVVVILL